MRTRLMLLLAAVPDFETMVRWRLRLLKFRNLGPGFLEVSPDSRRLTPGKYDLRNLEDVPGGSRRN
jgi:hypothetical protein